MKSYLKFDKTWFIIIIFFIFCIKPLTFGLQKWPSEMQPGLVHTEIFLPPIQLVQAGILIASR